MRRRFLSNINKSKYFTIEAMEDGLTVSLLQNACEYCIDNGDWMDLRSGMSTPHVNKGQTLSFKGNLTPTEFIGIGTFTISKKCNVSGNIMSLLFGDDFEGQTDLTGYDSAFNQLFYNCSNIIDASQLILPAITLAESCYYEMFRYCTSLTQAPVLPAITLAENCYCEMFSGCTKLNYIKALFITVPSDYYTFNWVKGVSSKGTFVKSKYATWDMTGTRGIPAGWTVQTV